MTLLYGHDDDVAAWVAARLGIVFPARKHSIGVLDRDGTLIGGIVFADYTGPNIEFTAYSERAISRPVLKALFAYPFLQLGCLRLTARTRRSNKTVCSMLPRLGFEYEGTAKRYFGPDKADDAIVYGMLREHCRWLRC